MSLSDRSPANLRSRQTSRRTVLRLLTTVATGGLLTACAGSQPAPAPKATEPARPAEAPKPAAPAAQPAATAAPPAAAKPTEAAKPAAAAPAQAAPAASKKLGGELRLHMRTGSEEDTLKEMLPKFTQDTGVQVKLETIPTNEYFNKLNTMIAGNTIGDV
jgi:ABC-type glycerol-3-phosphate transport system substrate-binding protein